jgi:hypothetical protein
VDFREIKWEGVEGIGGDCCGTVEGQVVGCCERGNEPSVCMKCGEFLD